MKKIIKEYDLDCNDNKFLIEYLLDMPIALIALYVMENGNYYNN